MNRPGSFGLHAQPIFGWHAQPIRGLLELVCSSAGPVGSSGATQIWAAGPVGSSGATDQGGRQPQIERLAGVIGGQEA